MFEGSAVGGGEPQEDCWQFGEAAWEWLNDRHRPPEPELSGFDRANVQVLGRLLPGALISDMVAILGSMFFVVGDIDK